MKRVCKGIAPQTLSDYAAANPQGTWEQMRDESNQAVNDCQNQAMRDQGNLCAYCEQRISLDGSRRRQIEHFHPKSDKSETHNWELDWNNMLAVCDGGKGDKENYQLPQNLSCDARKLDYKGYLLNPLEIPAYPNLFALDKSNGHLKANEVNCAAVEISGNEYATTSELVNYTIEILNLNCDRLVERRLQLVWNIEHNIKTIRDKGFSPSALPAKLIPRYFGYKWPEFFTTLRFCLGTAAEEYLKSIDYCG